MSATDAISAQIERATKRVAQLQARRALREMRRATVARARARKLDARRKYQLGESGLLAGLADWQPAELVGLMLDGKERFGASPTMRMGLRKRGEAHLEAAQDGSASPTLH